jgi:alpha-L-fucosidase
VRLRKFLPLGQRINDFALEAWHEGQWCEFFKWTSVGSQRLVRTHDIPTSQMRLRIISAAACPAISELGAYAEPDRPNSPRRRGTVSMAH